MLMQSSVEQLADADAYNCDTCKVQTSPSQPDVATTGSSHARQEHTSASRSTRLENAPEILICHLKRFRHDGMMGQVCSVARDV
jgi:ubiquitin C-terminal hydrolase